MGLYLQISYNLYDSLTIYCMALFWNQELNWVLFDDSVISSLLNLLWIKEYGVSDLASRLIR